MFERLKDGIVDQQLMSEAAAANPSLPIVIDEGTRLDRVNAPGGRKFVYNYTLLDASIEADDFSPSDVRDMVDSIKPGLIQNLKAEATVAWHRQNGVIFVYKYFDTKKKPLMEIVVSPADYNSSAAPAQPQRQAQLVNYIHVSYDWVDNGAGELMLAMDAPEGTADDDNARLVYNKFTKEGLLFRQGSQVVHLPIVVDAVAKMLTGGLTQVLVTEMLGDDIDDTYYAQVEITNENKRLPQYVYDNQNKDDSRKV